MELDHIFICVEKGAPEADVLIDFGLKEGSGGRHPGQGTANRRFFFHNFMLELLWIEDAVALQSEHTSRTRLWDRFANAGHSASPFGVCFRPGGQHNRTAPFPAWQYRPRYLPHHAMLEVGDNTPLAEPMWLFFGHGVRPDSQPQTTQPLKHKAGLKQLDLAHIRVRTHDRRSRPARAATESGWVRLRTAADPVLELEFDQCRCYERLDFRPRLPLLIRW